MRFLRDECHKCDYASPDSSVVGSIHTGGLMRIKTAVLISAVTLAGFAGCKHKTGTGGGGGGGWFVGTDSMMRNITDQGQLGAGYDIGTTGTLNSIACRYLDEAWVVGDAGTVLYTSDAGASWTVQNIGTTANL